MPVKIEVSASDIRSVKLALSGIKNGAPRALTAGINKSIKTTQVQAVKLIGAELNLKAARIKSDFTQKKATITKSKYAQMYLGKFIDDLLQIYPDELIKKCCTRKRLEGLYCNLFPLTGNHSPL